MRLLLNITTLGLLVILLASCAKTRDGLDVNTINNIIRTGRWETVTQTFYPAATPTVGVTEELVSGLQYAEFKSDNRLHFYDADQTEYDTRTYSLQDTQTMILDGDAFKIQETLGGSISKMTLIKTDSLGKTVVLFLR